MSEPLGSRQPYEWRYKHLSEQHWETIKEFFQYKLGMTEEQSATAADELGRYMDLVWK